MELLFIRDMFDTIAPRYDFLNRLLSLRRDVYWRRLMVERLELPQNSTILDAACGTGDVMIELLSRKSLVSMVIGVDFAPRMLGIARNKLAAMQMTDRSYLLAGDNLRLPIAPESVDAITIAFGIRNIMDRAAALAAFSDCLKPGGMLAVLELATPRQHALKRLYLAYFERLLPSIGGFFSKNRAAYRYLPASVLRFPEPEAFGDVMRAVGFQKVEWKRLTFGLATLYTGKKPGKG